MALLPARRDYDRVPAVPQAGSTASRPLLARLAAVCLARPVTLDVAFDPKNNSIGFLRFFLASLVIVYHSYVLGGYGEEWLLRHTGGQTNSGGVAVLGFFALSGFLVTASFVRGKSVFRFLWHRILRIMPGF